MPDKELITIKQTREILGVSIDTLRRWDKNKKLPAMRLKARGYRYYDKNRLAELLPRLDIYRLGLKWAGNKKAIEPLADFYCPTSSIFQARLSRLENEVMKAGTLGDKFSLLIASAGEIGNNAYDHNLGNWPDIPGVFFIHDLNRRQLMIADRGQGVLTTLRKVKPSLANDKEAIKAAFTEIISARAPESRGNGLKFVKQVAINNQFDILFQSGRAELRINRKNPELIAGQAKIPIKGCLAVIKF